LKQVRPLPPCEPPAGRLWVGFSGGLDSSVLLHWLKQHLPKSAQLRAIHVHHGLHADADAWLAHCQTVCDAAGIELHGLRIELNEPQRNIEAQARKARFAAFQSRLAEGDTLALAHHADDVAETLLLRLMRGAGSRALANMQTHGQFGALRLWRPLLGNSRNDLLAYARAQDLPFIEDGSNADLRFDRNFLRHMILPQLDARFGHVQQRLLHSATQLQRDAELLQPRIDQALQQCRSAHGLQLATLHTLPEALQAHVLRAWLNELRHSPPGSAALHELLRQIAAYQTAQQIQYRSDSYCLQVWNGTLYCTAEHPETHDDADFSVHWDGAQPLTLPRGGLLHWQGQAPLAVRVCYRQGGERIRLVNRNMHHSVKKLLSAQIPPWQRDALPFVYNESGELLAVGSVLISQTLADLTERTGSRLHWAFRGMGNEQNTEESRRVTGCRL
jgi:tRNA(Ile)-lysidine synthase